MNTDMTSSRPYLLRALNEWILDNDMTPHIVVDAMFEHVVVPTQYVEANKIVLNISPSAVSNFNITNEFISFSARFSGKAMEIFVPVLAVQALYSKENGQGMVFNDEKANQGLLTQGSLKQKASKPQAVTSAKTVESVKSDELKVDGSDTLGAKEAKLSSVRQRASRPSLKLVD